MKIFTTIIFGGVALVVFAAVLYLVAHVLNPRYKVESNGSVYRVTEKARLSYLPIPDHSERVGDRFINCFGTYQDAQDLISYLQGMDKLGSWKSISSPVRRSEANIISNSDPPPVPASKCMSTSTKGFVVGETRFRDIRGDTWVYTGVNSSDVNDYRNWKPAEK
jgi:hypothetical protein